LISRFFAPHRALLPYKAQHWLGHAVKSLHMFTLPFTVPGSSMPSTWIWSFIFSEIYVCILVFPSFFRPWFRDPNGMTTSLITICCQTASRAGPAQLTRQTRQSHMDEKYGGESGRWDKLLRLLSAVKLLMEGGGGKPQLRAGWQETSSRPSYAFVYFSKSRPW